MTRSATTRRTLEADGVERAWLEVRGRGDARPDARPDARLLVALHGSNQTPASFRRASSGIFERWLDDTEPGVVVYPESYRRGLWNDARVSTRSRARDDGVDDVAFLRSLVERYREGGVREVHAVGFSNGGQMAIRMVRDTAGVFDGVALIGATMPVEGNVLPAGPAVPPPVPMLLVHGTSDGVVPFGGGIASIYGMNPRGEMRSFEDSVAFWREAAGLTAQPIETVLRSHRRRGAVSTRLAFRQPGRPPVTAITIGGGGHWIPRDVPRPAVLGRVADEVDLIGEMRAALAG